MSTILYQSLNVNRYTSREVAHITAESLVLNTAFENKPLLLLKSQHRYKMECLMWKLFWTMEETWKQYSVVDCNFVLRTSEEYQYLHYEHCFELDSDMKSVESDSDWVYVTTSLDTVHSCMHNGVTIVCVKNVKITNLILYCFQHRLHSSAEFAVNVVTTQLFTLCIFIVDTRIILRLSILCTGIPCKSTVNNIFTTNQLARMWKRNN